MTSHPADPGLLADSLSEWIEAGRPGACLPPAKKPPRSVTSYEMKRAATARDQYAARRGLPAETDADRRAARDRDARALLASVPAEVIRNSGTYRDHCKASRIHRYPDSVRKRALYLIRRGDAA